MPRHLISDAHEWINEIPTVPIYLLQDISLFTYVGSQMPRASCCCVQCLNKNNGPAECRSVIYCEHGREATPQMRQADWSEIPQKSTWALKRVLFRTK